MTAPISENIESSEKVIADSNLNAKKNKLALFGEAAIKVIIGVVGLMIGSVVGVILALTFGFIDFVC